MSQHRTSPARTMALTALDSIDPVAYGKTRNHLDGAVTRLSRYLRHGVLSLAEVRDAAIRLVGSPARAYKLLQELAWRDYFRRVWNRLGDDIWTDLEPYKTGYEAADYADDLPADLLSARTGIDYIDHFVTELHDTGYLHNHARMWLAAYVVHGRRVKWQAGARWFLSCLLDGDEASNNLSWQWCASTFSHKPYLFNRENVLQFSGVRFAAHQRNDPFDDSYDAIAVRLLRDAPPGSRQKVRRRDLTVLEDPPPPPVRVDPDRVLVWVHDGMMSPSHPAVQFGRTHLFVWDDPYHRDQRHSDKRLEFVASALFCPAIHSGDRGVAQTLLDNLDAYDAVVTGATPDPRLRRVIRHLESYVTVVVLQDKPLVRLTRPTDLTRFSRYWTNAEASLVRA